MIGMKAATWNRREVRREKSLRVSNMHVGSYVLLISMVLVVITPFLYALYTALTEQQYLNQIAPLDGFTLDNFRQVFETNIGRWILNSTIVTVSITIGNLLVNTPAAYALAKIKFPGRKVVFYIIIAMMMIPFQTILIPLYLMMVKLKWLNTYACLIFPFLFQGFLVFMMRQSFVTFPDEILEAAKLDGLSTAGAFFRIVLPNSKTAITTQIIYSVTGTWNFVTWGATFINKKEMYILPQGLNTLKNTYYSIPNLTMAGVVVMTVPMIVIFFLLQKQFVQGSLTSGVKG